MQRIKKADEAELTLTSQTTLKLRLSSIKKSVVMNGGMALFRYIQFCRNCNISLHISRKWGITQAFRLSLTTNTSLSLISGYGPGLALVSARSHLCSFSSGIPAKRHRSRALGNGEVSEHS